METFLSVISLHLHLEAQRVEVEVDLVRLRLKFDFFSEEATTKLGIFKKLYLNFLPLLVLIYQYVYFFPVEKVYFKWTFTSAALFPYTR